VIALVLGGARSGKSAVAERLCHGAVVYVATYVVDPADSDMDARVAAHQARRPAAWTTVEASPPDVVGAVRAAPGGATVLLDSLTTWVAAGDADGSGLVAALTERDGDAVVVSDEVGMGVHPSSEEGRQFRDRLGDMNRLVAEAADEVLLVVAGRTLRLDR
jgi:adenosyl cobinamide kinase/adenosyl cobinamide phosphate guanylyltransferase